VVNVSASPYGIGKPQSRPAMYARQARRLGCPVVVVNQVGAHDELIFDGNSCAFDSQGNLIAHCAEFAEDLVIVDLEMKSGRVETPADGVESIFKTLVFGIREYVRKAGRTSVVVGLSGGIDSAVVATLAVHALGKSNVNGVTMPGRHSSDHSLQDAEELATRLGIAVRSAPIGDIHTAYETAVPGGLTGMADENVQARIRGNILMAISNREGHLVLGTGNKSELAVGYGTLYGDMIGALAPIADLTKTRVRELARWINARFGETIPWRTIEKPPSAELSPGQADENELGPYHVLDQVITQYVEEEKSVREIVEGGIEEGYVNKIVRMIDAAEFKRRQAPIGLKVTRRAFGPGRPMPVVR
jgi:NAD+ synthase (glutamine-hydrolysing)